MEHFASVSCSSLAKSSESDYSYHLTLDHCPVFVEGWVPSDMGHWTLVGQENSDGLWHGDPQQKVNHYDKCYSLDKGQGLTILAEGHLAMCSVLALL